MENFTHAIGLKSVEYYSSEEGTPVFKDHEYEVIAIYNNTSDEIQDAMAVLRLYAHEKTFSGPIASRSVAPTP